MYCTVLKRALRSELQKSSRPWRALAAHEFVQAYADIVMASENSHTASSQECGRGCWVARTKRSPPTGKTAAEAFQEYSELEKQPCDKCGGMSHKVCMSWCSQCQQNLCGACFWPGAKHICEEWRWATTSQADSGDVPGASASSQAS